MVGFSLFSVSSLLISPTVDFDHPSIGEGRTGMKRDKRQERTFFLSWGVLRESFKVPPRNLHCIYPAMDNARLLTGGL